MIKRAFWKGKKVFLTGHTGFKGAWLSLWLTSMGADVYGYALLPPTNPCLYELAEVNDLLVSTIADIRDGDMLRTAMSEAQPDIVFHMAAQPLVRESYQSPAETYAVNVMGTVNLLESVRHCQNVKVVVNVTTDKCYENQEWHWGYRENEPMGGFDPYSSSKGCSELVTAAYRSSFFNPQDFETHGVAVASARAGNVIGGGDWAADRLICDCVRSLLDKHPVKIRNPKAIRPWQHVLEPLSGYLALAQKLFEDGVGFAESWNFGPDESDARKVEWIVKRLCSQWGENATYQIDNGEHPHEATYLKLDCSKAKSLLHWHPRWNLDVALDSIVEWTQSYRDGENMRNVTLSQISKFQMFNKGST